MDCFYITMEIAIRERLIEAAKWVNKLKNGQDCISFFVEPKQKNIIIVATHHDKKYLETIEFDPLTMRKPFSFAIPANYFIECNPQLDQTLPLVLKTQKTVNNCTVDLMGIDKLREYVTLSASQEHIDYRAMLSMLKINTVKKSTFDRLLYEINTYQPIEFVEVNAQQHEMKIQRDNNVVNYALPDSLGLSFNLALNNDAFKRLKAICDNNQAADIGIAMHDDQVTLTIENQIYCHSLTELAEFRLRKTQHFNIELALTLNFNELKKEVRAYQEYPEAKKTKAAYLLIENSELTICSNTENCHFACPILVEDISGVSDARLYLVDLKEIKDAPITDVTSTEEMKVRVLIDDNGVRKLGFYNSKNNNHPYASIRIDAAQSEVNEILQLKKKQQAKAAENQKIKQEANKQGDMFGFSEEILPLYTPA